MSMSASTMTTGNLLSHLYRAMDHSLARLTATQAEITQSNDVRIAAYTPVLTVANAWLAVVEARIRGSIRPDEAEASTEWLNRYAADAAITFFRNVADLLPSEPHIAATQSGDLVAEFETAACTMTTVVSDRETILFGLCAPDRPPIHTVIRRGSNQLRDQVKAFTHELTAGLNGAMGASR